MLGYTIHYGLNPWRRYFARIMDFILYHMIVYIFCVLVFRVNITNVSDFASYFIFTVPTMIFMLFVEPFFLSKFGTTPGKALLGIRVLSSTGDNLSYAVAVRRTYRALLTGLGFQIPIISLITLILSYFKVKRMQSMTYDVDLEISYEVHKISPIRYILYPLIELLVIALSVAIYFTLFLPLHTGDITKEEYIENCNHFASVIGLNDIYVDSSGIFRQVSNSINFDPYDLSLPTLTINTTDGYVDSVSFELDSEGSHIISSPTYAMMIATRALDSDINYIDAISPAYLSIMVESAADGFEYSTDTVRIFADIDADDYWNYGDGTLYYRGSNYSSARYSASFFAEKL